MIPFGQFAPSQASHIPGTIDVAEGVYPLGAQDWQPFPRFNDYSEALGDACIGANQIQGPDGTEYTYAATVDGLFRMSTASSPYPWTDVTGSVTMGLSDEALVQFLAFGDKVLAFGEGLTGIAVADIGSGNFSIISDSPTAAYGVVFGDRVWALKQDTTPNRVQWSGVNDHTIWGDYSRGADFQVLEEGGQVTGGAVVGNTLYIFQEDGIQAFMRDPGPLLFQRQPVRRNFGAPSARSIVQGPNGAYFLSEDGFYVAGGGGVQNIGSGVVDEWFFGQVDLDKIWSVQGAHDPANKIIVWRYPTSGFSGAGYTNRVIGYAYNLNRWFGFDLDCAWLLRAASPGLTLETIPSTNIDTMTVSLDSRTWNGGRPQLGGFDSDFKFGFFDGTPMACRIETADLQLTPQRRTFVNGFRPIIEGTNAFTGQLGRKATPTAATTWNTAGTANRSGIVTQRASGLYLKARLNIEAGEPWDVLSGVEMIGQRAEGMS